MEQLKHFKTWVPRAGAVLCIAVPMLAAATPEIDSLVQEQLAANGHADVFVKMATDAVPMQAGTQPTHAARVQYVYDTLTGHANRDQRSIRKFLDGQGVEYTVYWINNSLFIRNADRALIEALERRLDTSYIRGDHIVPLHEPVEARAATRDAIQAIEWGVDLINAPAVWATGNKGEGVVVANNDTGVRYTHSALVGSYRGNLGGGNFDHNYNWFDPSGVCLPGIPCDNHNHGSHTMGTMVGDDGGSNQVGVAPGAKWIATKGCQSGSCSNSNLIGAAQWIACPTEVDGVSNPDCSKAPHVVNNSWGGGGGDPWYVSYVQAWIDAGIMPVFSAGNSGSSCSSMGTPGDYRNVIGVGATTINDVLASFSSKGPGSFRPLKPDFAAPGDNVRSAFAGNDNSYGFFSGTSMAAPHLAGTVALMLNANPNATLIELYAAMRNTTEQNLGAPPGPDACAGRAYNVYPNAIYGWGRINAEAAVNAIAP